VSTPHGMHDACGGCDIHTVCMHRRGTSDNYYIYMYKQNADLMSSIINISHYIARTLYTLKITCYKLWHFIMAMVVFLQEL